MVFLGTSWASASPNSKLALDLCRLWSFSFWHSFLRLSWFVWKELSISRSNHNIDLAAICICLVRIPHDLILRIIELWLNIILKCRLQRTHILLRRLPCHAFNVLLYVLILIIIYHILLHILRLLLRWQITQLISHLILTQTDLQIECFLLFFIFFVFRLIELFILILLELHLVLLILLLMGKLNFFLRVWRDLFLLLWDLQLLFDNLVICRCLDY
jgi:hypothetical protein